VHLILEYVAACRDPYREGQINVLDLVQNIVVKFAYHRSDSKLETVTAQEDSTHMCSLQSMHGRSGLEGYEDQPRSQTV
jgi:hypothetical protein